MASVNCIKLHGQCLREEADMVKAMQLAIISWVITALTEPLIEFLVEWDTHVLRSGSIVHKPPVAVDRVPVNTITSFRVSVIFHCVKMAMQP
jgi:hypothetical protein